MELNLNTSTWIWLFSIVATFFICFICVIILKKKDKLLSNRHIIEFFPSLISSLGVLGTFYGITVGLLAFDSSNLDQSIPDLLDGLKTAFFTSLAGMTGSMILSAFINRKQDEKSAGISDINQAAIDICQAVKEMSSLNSKTMQTIQHQLKESEADRKAFYRSIGDVMEQIKKSQMIISESINKINTTQSTVISAVDSIVLSNRSQDVTLSAIKELNNSILNYVYEVEKGTEEQTMVLKTIQKNSSEVSDNTRHLGEMLDMLSGMSGGQEEMISQVSKIKDIIHNEVVQIEEDMEKTNKLLERKFDEFTDLLKKSNTEALVEVMTRVTEEFQKQMNSLINKLIQENFDQLNNSVEKLNQWQHENKEMIASLTRQYKEMSDNFEATSTSLTRVKEDTAVLVSDGGKLKQIINALNQVIVQDERFIQLTTELQKTATLSKSNMESFDESTKLLNDWVRKQKHFVDGVLALTGKLDELNNIRDYGEQFWKGPREKMEEGVSIISKGSQTLNSQLTALDRQFYARLSATLAELDNCITKMVEQVSKRK